MAVDVLEREEPPFPHALPEFQRLFPDETASRTTLSVPDGAMASSARTARWLMNHCTFLRALGYFATVIVATTPASQPVPLWNALTRRFRSGSGLRTWSPAKHPACRLSSCSANSAYRVTKPPFRFSTSCAPAWCVPTRTGSAANQKRSLRLMKPGLVAAHAERGAAFTTGCSWPVSSAATCKSRKPFCPSFTSCFPISRSGFAASARNTWTPISTNSPSVSTAASIPSTLSAHCSASRAMSPLRHMPSFTLQNHEPLHLVAGCDNRISTDFIRKIVSDL